MQNLLAILEKIATTDIINPLTTLVAAFAGSWAAFRFQMYERNSETEKRNISAANRALFILLQQANGLRLFQVDFIIPFRDDPARSLRIRPTFSFEETALKFDLKELEFLLGTTLTHQLLMDLLLEERRFAECIRVINARSKFHFDVVQKKLNTAGISEGKPYTRADILAVLGEFDFLHLQRLTDDVVRSTDRSVRTLIEIKDRLRAELIRRFPKAHFLDFEHIPDLPPSNAGGAPPNRN